MLPSHYPLPGDAGHGHANAGLLGTGAYAHRNGILLVTPPVTPLDDKIMFILDARGRVQFCSDPLPFASPGEGLIGQSFRQLVPGLPLRERTPGYNVAYTRFSFGDDRWRRLPVKTVNDTFALAEIRVTPIPIEHGHCLLGLVRLNERPGGRRRAS